MKGLFARLKKKYGPLPLWSWITIASTAGAYYLRKRGVKPSTDTTDQNLPAPVSVGAGDYGDIGSTAPTGTTQEPGVFPFPDRKLSDALGGLRDDVYGAIDTINQTGEDIQSHKDTTKTNTPTGDSVAPDTMTRTPVSLPQPTSKRRKLPTFRKKPKPPAPISSRPPQTRKGGHTAPPIHGAGFAGARPRKPPTGTVRPARPRVTPPPSKKRARPKRRR